MNRLIARTVATALLATSFAVAYAGDVKVSLTGDQEVPAVTSPATGTGTITIGDDKTVKGKVTTTGVAGTMAHIHLAPVGQNGPPVITLEKSGDNAWSVPAGSTLTDSQYQAFKAGNLYVNVHSDAHKSGEIRAQLKP